MRDVAERIFLYLRGLKEATFHGILPHGELHDSPMAIKGMEMMAILKVFLVIFVFSISFIAAAIISILAFMPAIEIIFIAFLTLLLAGGYLASRLCKNLTDAEELFLYFSNYVVLIAIPLLFLLLLGFAFSRNAPWDRITENILSLCLAYGVCSSISGLFICRPKIHPVLYGINGLLAFCFFVGFFISSAALGRIFAP